MRDLASYIIISHSESLRLPTVKVIYYSSKSKNVYIPPSRDKDRWVKPVYP